MDASGVVLRQPLRFPSSSCTAAPASAELKTSSASIVVGRRKLAPSLVLSSEFCDQGHVKYYNSYFTPSSSTATMMSAISGKKEKAKASKKMKMKKKQLKLLKGLFRDLSTFSRIGFGFDSDENMISEASEILLNQLQKLKAEKKEMKRKLKEEEKARLISSSSSSSDSSSDSECGEIVDMNSLKKSKRQNNLQLVIEDAAKTTPAYKIPISPSSVSNVLDKRQSSSCNADKTGEESLGSNVLTKIEVCMGGKCKKSGAGALLEEFQKVVGIDGSVSGCKCMGKCRDGPNVKVLADKCVNKAPTTKSMCVGVGLEDVNVIVANLLGQNNDNQVGFVASS